MKTTEFIQKLVADFITSALDFLTIQKKATYSDDFVFDNPRDIPDVNYVDTAISEAASSKTIIEFNEVDTAGSDPNYIEVPSDVIDNGLTIIEISFVLGGVKYYINQDQIQGSNIYGFPTIDNDFTIKLVYI